MGNQDPSTNNIKKDKISPMVYIVFVSLLLDLLAFTMILPLLPSLLEHYQRNDDSGLYQWLLNKISYFQKIIGAPDQYSSVLFGGFLGSMFSFLQFIASPILGGISDVKGRKVVMIGCLVGISLSYILWALSKNLVLFIIARFIGGLCKGNVSLSMAIISDASSVKTRGIGMALVGIAFSLGFIIGPLIGAIFAMSTSKTNGEWFVAPAMFAFFLSFLDLIFFVIFFQESLPKEKRAKDVWRSLQNAKALIDLRDLFGFRPVRNIKDGDLIKLRKLGLTYFIYLFIYSGLEFTLTFLTHHTFQYNSMQQGWMFFSIGLVMAIIQGSYVRRLPPNKITSTAINGLWIIIPSFICVGIATKLWTLYLGLLLFAVSTALVVPCMMTMASLYGSPQEKGTVMGIFRSLGALARALGPILASVSFWGLGSTTTYLAGAFALLWPVLLLKNSV
uniref:Major facilitator superfamily (MFS) profile domain-containing protein n=1 Tax=Photinus pyralis TaxID=7054 RepID=A0A1Y1LCF1_PHOPY